MRIAIRFAMLSASYLRQVDSRGLHYTNVVDDLGHIVARRIEYFATAQELDDAIEETIDYLRDQYSEEGMYVIENILLRPAASTALRPMLSDC